MVCMRTGRVHLRRGWSCCGRAFAVFGVEILCTIYHEVGTRLVGRLVRICTAHEVVKPCIRVMGKRHMIRLYYTVISLSLQDFHSDW